MFTIQWGNNWKQENGIHIFNVSDTNQTAKIKVVGDFSDFESQTFGQVFGSKILKTSWKLTKDDGTIFGSYKASGENGISFSVAKKNVGSYSVRIEIEWIYFTSSGFFKKKAIKEASFKIETEGDNGNDGNETSSGGDDSFALPFKSTITNVNTTTNLITTQEDIDKSSLGLPQTIINTITETKETINYAIKYGAVDYQNLNVLLNAGGVKNIITNTDIDVESTPIDPYSVVLKLYEPLSNDVGVKNKVSVVKEMAEPIRETIRLAPFNDADLGDRFLYEADDKSIDYINNLRTRRLSLNDTLTSDNFISSSIRDNILSGSVSAEVNVDYNDYGNFSIFGSAQKRLENFRTKLVDYEFYSKESGSLAAQTASAVFKSEITRNEEFKRDITNNFDHYEKYLFYESSSYSTSSFGLGFDTSWPKENSTKPHNVLSVSASAATTWYNNNSTSASIYDQNNPNRLVNLIPEHIKRDSENQPFLDFLDMVGHYYDNIWVYVKAMTDTYDRRENLTEGLSKDLVWTISNAFGWKQPSGTEITELHRLVTGQYLSGSFGSEEYKQYSETSGKEIQQEIWNRVLTSMPYILKNKGTKESIQALVNAYGIPPTILKVREYGGSDNKDYQPTFETQQRFTRALDFKNSQYIQTQWKETSGSLRTPDTIEFRFRTASGSNQVLVAKDQRFAVRLLDEGSISDNKGKVEFLITSSLGTTSVTSSLFPVYNNEFWSVGITRESSSGYNTTADRTLEYNTTSSMKYNLFVKQYESGVGRILYDSSTSMTLSGSTALTGLTSSLQNGQWTASGDIFFGSTGSFGDLGVEFTGSLQEIRYYNSPLTESAFNNHTRAPKAINGNHASSSFTDLVFRLRLDDNKNLSTSSDLSNIAPDQNLFANSDGAFESGSAVGFTANTFSNVEQEEKTLLPNIGISRKTNSKIRIEQNYVPTSSDGLIYLSSNESVELGNLDTMPKDSNKLGVFFSPTDVINQDIIESIADLDIEEEIADPRDEKEFFYRGLRTLADSYFQKYTGTNSFWDYMRLIKYYDQSIFEQIKKVTPARAKTTYGVLIEPTILERSKNIILKDESFENLQKEGEINVGLLEATQSLNRPVMSITSSRLDYEGTISESLAFEPSTYLLKSASLSSSLGFTERRYLEANVEYGSRLYMSSSRVTFTPQLSSSRIYSPDIFFTEAVSTFVSSSREHPTLEEIEIHYTTGSSLGYLSPRLVDQAHYSSSNFVAYSSSLKPARVQRPTDYISGLKRGYQGTKNTRKTTTDGQLPFIVKSSPQTAIISTKGSQDTGAGTGGKRLEVRKVG
jgi:hypothetical protein